MGSISKVQDIEEISDLVHLMERLKIPSKALKSFVALQQRATEVIQERQKEARWSPGMAFSQFAVARDEDISARKQLYKFYKKVQLIIQDCEDVLLSILDRGAGSIVMNEIEKKTEQLLQNEYVILFAGETSSGKSSLINLFLGEEILPYAQLPLTSTICEVRYGSSKKFKIHYNDAKRKSEEYNFLEPNEGKSYTDQLLPYLDIPNHRHDGLMIKKIEIFWSNELLKDGLIIVDSPGVGENPELDKIVAEYLNKAFFFIYVINSNNAGGVARDRLGDLLKKASEGLISERMSKKTAENFVSEDSSDVLKPFSTSFTSGDIEGLPQKFPKNSVLFPKLTAGFTSENEPKKSAETSDSGNATDVLRESAKKFIPEAAVFVCNKWDCVDTKRENVEGHIKKKLEEYWVGVDCQSQVVKLSTTEASIWQDYGMISPQFRVVVNSVKSMLFKTIKARLKKECRWLSDLVSRIHFIVTVLDSKNKKDNVFLNLLMAKTRLEVVKQTYKKCIKELEYELKSKIDNAAESLHVYLTKPGFEEKFCTWSGIDDDFPEEELTPEVEAKVREAICNRFGKEINDWEAKNHVITSAHDSMMEKIKSNSDSLAFQIKEVEEIMVNPSSIPNLFLSTLSKVVIGVTSPLWFPIAIIGGVLCLPIVAGKAVVDFGIKNIAKKTFKTDKKSYVSDESRKFLNNHRSKESLQSFITPKFDMVQLNLEEMKSNFTNLINADADLITYIIYESAYLSALAEKYAPVNADCENVRGELSLFTIEKIIPKDIKKADLRWGSCAIGSGTFADVFKGSLKTAEGEHLDVAVKICKDMLTEKNAHDLMSQEMKLGSINHENVVKFYGSVLQEESGGRKFILVMELCDESLRMYLEKYQDTLPGRASQDTRHNAVSQMLKWAKDIACGLEYLHGKGLVHRDLKPDNILVGLDRKSLKIADVGIAKDEKDITGTVAGTPLYMAPEVYTASKRYMTSADIYSFGLVLWELWYGQRIFSEFPDGKLLMSRIMDGLRPQHIKGCQRVISQFDALMKNCWETEPENRITAAQCVKHINITLKWWN